MKYITKQRLQSYLNKKSSEDLRDEIIELFFRFETIKDYFSIRVSPSFEATLLDKYKRRLQSFFDIETDFGNEREIWVGVGFFGLKGGKDFVIDGVLSGVPLHQPAGIYTEKKLAVIPMDSFGRDDDLPWCSMFRHPNNKRAIIKKTIKILAGMNIPFKSSCGNLSLFYQHYSLNRLLAARNYPRQINSCG